MSQWFQQGQDLQLPFDSSWNTSSLASNGLALDVSGELDFLLFPPNQNIDYDFTTSINQEPRFNNFGAANDDLASNNTLMPQDWQPLLEQSTVIDRSPYEQSYGDFTNGTTSPNSSGSSVDHMLQSTSFTPTTNGLTTQNSSPKKRPAAEQLTGPSVSPSLSEENDQISKRQRNTEAARRYRQRKVDRTTELEEALAAMTKERDDLKLKLARSEAEADVLRGMVSRRS